MTTALKPPATYSSWSPATRTFLKVTFGLMLIAALLWRLDLHKIGTAFRGFTWPYLFGTLGLFVISLPISAVRWRLFAPRFSFHRLLALTSIGQFYAVVLPGQIAGEAVKAYRLAKGNADAERLAASVVIDRLIGTISLLLVAAGGMIVSPHAIPTALRQLFAILVVLLTCSLFVLNIPAAYLLAERVIGKLATFRRLERIAPMLERLMIAWREFSRSPSRLVASLLLGVALQFITIGMYSLLARNLNIHVALADWAWIVGVTSLAMLLPVSIGGIGMREGSLVGCLGFLGVAGEPAIVLSLGLFLTSTLTGALIGGALELAPTRND